MNAIRELQQTSILVVDDDILMQNVIKAALENMGFRRVQIEENGNAALACLNAEHSIELVLLDLQMPEMDGIRFMRQLAESRPDIDVILASGQRGRLLSTAISLGRSMGLNVLGALQKPLQLKSLQALLEKRQSITVEPEDITVIDNPLAREDLHDGLLGSERNNHPHLLYQPIVSIGTGSIAGVEVLARWWNRERGILTPDLFLPLIELEGLLDQLTREIYRLAIEQMAQWNKIGKSMSVAVNLSINSFRDESFSRFLIDTAAAQEIDYSKLIFEMTESQASSVTPECLEALLNLRLKGFHLSIDDFGTGSSSLAHIKNIPFTELKIDREFITGAAFDPEAHTILEESVNLARRLSMAVVAEGVETREEWDLVERLGCDSVQGYYCSKPLDSRELIKFLDAWRGPHFDPQASQLATLISQ